MSSSGSERRKHSRFDTELKIYFKVSYDLNTRVEYQVVDEKMDESKHCALSKNVSAEGLRFTSSEKLVKGDILYLEVFLPGEGSAINMEGLVMWSEAIAGEKKSEPSYDTGIKVVTVDGKSVPLSIFLDEPNKVVWSAVLESVFGSFKDLSLKRKDSK